MKLKNSAFTLIELLVTITIVGVLATVSVATFQGYQEKAKNAKNLAECKQIEDCQKMKNICLESGDSEEICNKLCDVRGLVCNNNDSYPPESEWTAASFFSFSNGVITAYSNSGPKNIVIPKTINGEIVTEIGGNVFKNKQIESVRIPNSVNKIGGGAFHNNKLTSISIPNSIETIPMMTFSQNELTSLYIPDSVTKIVMWGFENNSSLTSVSIGKNTIYSITPYRSFPTSCTEENGCIVRRP